MSAQKETPNAFAGIGRATDHVKIEALTKMEDIAGVDVALLSVLPTKTELGPAVKIECLKEDGEKIVLLTGGVAIYPKLLELEVMRTRGEVQFPVLVRFVKNGRTWIIE